MTELNKPIAQVTRDVGDAAPGSRLKRVMTKAEWLKNVRQHPNRPFVGSGELPDAD